MRGRRKISRYSPSCTLALALVAAGCGGGGDGGGATTGGEAQAGGTLVFAGAADPVVLDGALVSDGESLRVIDQIFEGLVALAPGTTEIVPALADELGSEPGWSRLDVQPPLGREVPRRRAVQRGGRLLQLQPLVQLHGVVPEPAAPATTGRPCSAGSQRRTARDAPTDSLYKSCEATDDTTVVLNLTQASSSFLGALVAAGVRDAEPDGDAEVRRRRGHGRRGRHVPPDRQVRRPSTRRAPARSSSSRGRSATSSCSSATTTTGARRRSSTSVIFQPIADNAARLQALQTGEIQGYDLVEPAGRRRRSSGDSSLKVLDRPAFNVAYVAINQVDPADRPTRGAPGRRLRPRPCGASSRRSTPAAARWRTSSCRRRSCGYVEERPEVHVQPREGEAAPPAGGAARFRSRWSSGTRRTSRVRTCRTRQRNFQAFAASLEKSGFKVIAEERSVAARLRVPRPVGHGRGPQPDRLDG